MQYGKNIISLFNRLPPNSPFRVSILKHVTVGVHVPSAALDFNTSTAAIYRAYRNSKDISHELLRYPISQRKMNDQELHIARAKEFFDEVIPVLSGRKYRVKKCTNDNLYALYYVHCMDRNYEPLSKNYLIYNLLQKELVHHSSDDTYCPQCYQLGELKKKETNLLTEKENSKILKLETHLETANKQSVFMKLTKSSLSNGDFGTETCIAVQDFTQIQVQGTFYQDLIICFYFFRDTGFERKYLHYVAAKSSDKNDINFVMHSWTNLFENGKLEGIKKVLLWSDGGPKHFKMTSCMHFFSSFQSKTSIQIIYNFFESYHGHFVCDGVASHTKKMLNVFQRDNLKPVNNSHQIVQLVSNMKNSSSSLYHGESLPTPKFKTFRGIRSYYKFSFEDDKVFAHDLSEKENPSTYWSIQSDIQSQSQNESEGEEE